MKYKHYLGLLPLVAAFTFVFSSCSSSDDVDSGDFGEITYESTTTVKDVPMSDTDLLMELALKQENMRLQLVKMSSNGWDGELFCGIGEKSDEALSRYFDFLTDILKNKDKYAKALQRLDQAGVFSKTTTRGIFDSLCDAVYGYGDAASEKQAQVMDRLRALKLLGNADAQEKLFNCLDKEYRGGHTNASDFFKSLNNRELNSIIYKIDYTWQHYGASQWNDANNPVGRYAEKANDDYKGPGNQCYEEAYKVSSKVAKGAGEVYAWGIDKATGGYGSAMNDMAEAIGETINLTDKIVKGNASGKDIAEYVLKRANDKLKSTIGDALGKGAGDEAVKFLCEETSDYATNKAIESLKDADAAKSAGMGQIEITGTKDMTPAAVIVVDEETGKISVAVADKNGNINMPSTTGKKKITVVSKDGKRSTQEVNIKPGKNELSADPDPEEPFVYISPEEKLSIGAEGGKLEAYIITNCKYARCRSNDKWIKSSRKDKNVYITVDENKEGEARTGSLTVDVSFDGKKVVSSTTIVIGQDGNTQANFSNIDRVIIEGKVYLSSPDVYEGAPQEALVGAVIDSQYGSFTSKPKGKSGLVIEGSTTERDAGGSLYSIYIEIDDVNAIATNKSIINRIKMTTSGITDVGIMEVKSDLSLDAENLPMEKTPKWGGYMWAGKESRGMKINRYTIHSVQDADVWGEKVHQEIDYTYVSNSANFLEVSILFK